LVPFVAVPAFGGTYRATGRYFSYLGDSPQEMVSNLLRNPGAQLRLALRPQRWKAVARLCWPTGFLFLLAPEIAAFTLPFLGYLLISTSQTMGRLGAWYPSPILPILYWAVGFGLSRLRGRWRTGALIGLLTAALAGYVSLSEIRPGIWARLDRFEVTAHHRQVEIALRGIPTDAIVAAQDPLVPHVSHRQRIYLFPWFPEESDPDYVVLDREMKTYPVKVPTYRTLFYDLLSGTEHEIERQIGSFYIFRHAGSVSPEVTRTEHWEESLTLIGYSVAAGPADGAFGPVPDALPAASTVRLSLFWRVDQPIEQNHTVFVHAFSHDGHLLAQHDSWPADAHRPTSVLPTGTVFRDVHYLAFSQPAHQDVLLHVGLYDGEGERLVTREGREVVTVSLHD
jgi:hypothetical protein